MYTIEQAIQAANALEELDQDILVVSKALRAKRDLQEELRTELQYNCPHVYEPAPRGFEHEGGTCTYCQLMEAYAPTLRAEWERKHAPQPEAEAAPTHTPEEFTAIIAEVLNPS